MALPKGIVEWLTFCHLIDHRDLQLILLKGHLTLEVFLSEVVRDKNLSFYARVKRFETVGKNSFLTSALLQINTMRNKLAHEWNFDANESALHQWADDVLINVPYEMVFRRTKRMKVIHAMAALAGAVYQCGKELGASEQYR